MRPVFLLAAVFWASGAPAQEVRLVGPTSWLNHSKAVVTHTIDDSTRFVPECLDAMDKYGIKATAFVSTQRPPIADLWPRLRKAVADGHEIGSHSRTHQCKWPDTEEFCRGAYSDDEIRGSIRDILEHTPQKYVWSWAYPCGNCADRRFVQERLAAAGYLAARTYPGEAEDRHNLPALGEFAVNPYEAAYTQVVQKKGGIAKTGRTSVPELNAVFDEVYRKGGIYHFVSHPQWLDYGPDGFYEQHLKHLGGRKDVWYVPFGLLYAYKAVLAQTEARRLGRNKFSVYNLLKKNMYPVALTLEFTAPSNAPVQVLANDKPLPERKSGLTDRWDAEYFRREGNTLYVTIRPDVVLDFK
jgi:peptidoglycan/xylan/chitin deacetylase (PgdA/CDA1 family)